LSVIVTRKTEEGFHLSVRIIAIPIIGAFIGWITNVFAIRLIFWPYEPIRVPLINWQIYGVIPKRRKELAATIGEVVEENLFSVEDFLAYLNSAEIKDKLFDSTLSAVKSAVIEKLPRYTPVYVKDILVNLLEEVLRKELPGMLDNLSNNISGEMRSHLSLRKIVEDRINQFDIRVLEEIILRVSERELGHIEIMGAVLGFIIGLVQAALASFL